MLWLKPAVRARWCPPPVRRWVRDVHGDWRSWTDGESTEGPAGLRQLLARYPDRPCWLLVDGTSVVRASLQMPIAAIDQLRKAARYEIDRQTPFAEGEVVYDARVIARDTERRQMMVELLAMPKARLQPVLEQLGEFGVALRGIDVADDDGRPLGVNLLEEGAPLRHPWRMFNLALVALVLVASSLALWRSVANERVRADLLEADLKQESERARGVTLQRQRLDTLVEGTRNALAERARRADLNTIGNALAERLPTTVYLERMSVQGERMQLTGQGAQVASLMSWLGANPLWDTPSLSESSINAAANGHERFSIELRLKPRGVK